MKQSINILISGGGTGGHIYPAIAIANELKERYPYAKFLFVGAKDKMEMEKVPEAGYEITGLWISGIQRKLTFKNLLFPLKLLVSLFKSRKIIKQFNPDIAIGTGGFASGPTIIMANMCKIPTLIQEQNSYPGITNKLLSRKSKIICVAYDGLDRFFPKEKIVKTGNPVRSSLLSIHTKDKILDGNKLYHLKQKTTTILVLGGSQAAKVFAEQLPRIFEKLKNSKAPIKIYQQCQNKQNEQLSEFYKKAKIDFEIFNFTNKITDYYLKANLVITRSGASVLGELINIKIPFISIPLPTSADNHQFKNAIYYKKKALDIL